MTPVWAMHDGDRGVVAEGGVGTRGAGRSKFFRYEVHCWRGGSIADIAQAVASPTRPTSDEATCRRLLTLLRSVPAGGGIRPSRRYAAMPGGDRNPPVHLPSAWPPWAYPQARVARGGQIPGRYLSRRVELPPGSLSAPCATGTFSEACGRTCDVR